MTVVLNATQKRVWPSGSKQVLPSLGADEVHRHGQRAIASTQQVGPRRSHLVPDAREIRVANEKRQKSNSQRGDQNECGRQRASPGQSYMRFGAPVIISCAGVGGTFTIAARLRLRAASWFSCKRRSTDFTWFGAAKSAICTSRRRLVMVATDRISAFDYVLGSGIPDKGRVLTQLSAFWFERTTAHRRQPRARRRRARVSGCRCAPYARHARGTRDAGAQDHAAAIECVARGYLSGSGWKDYQATGQMCGIPLPPGLRRIRSLA